MARLSLGLSKRRPQGPDIVDEVLHIAGALQISSFPRVVGTLWQAEDEDAADVVKELYTNQALTNTTKRGQPLHRDGAVVVLHEAVRETRDEDPELGLSWAQFVIFGA